MTDWSIGTEHPDTVSNLNNLAVLLHDQGNYDAAEPSYRHALAINEKVLGNEHPNTANSLNNLARLLHDKGNYDAAEPLYRRALTIREKVFGTEHTDTLNSRANLANLLKIRSNYTEAIQLYNILLSHYEKQHSPISHEVSITYWNLATCSWEIDDISDAEYYFRRELETLKKIHGDTHHATLESMQQLGVFLRDQGEYLEAEQLLNEVIKQREISSDTDENVLAGSLNALGLLLAKTGLIDEAIKWTPLSRQIMP